jgi:hypothetical protein
VKSEPIDVLHQVASIYMILAISEHHHVYTSAAVLFVEFRACATEVNSVETFISRLFKNLRLVHRVMAISESFYLANDVGWRLPCQLQGCEQ